MHRVLTGVPVLIALLAVLSGCSNNAAGGAPPTADEAARQSALTQQGIATTKPGGEAAQQSALTQQGITNSGQPPASTGR